jgi:hypothetical protein
MRSTVQVEFLCGWRGFGPGQFQRPTNFAFQLAGYSLVFFQEGFAILFALTKPGFAIGKPGAAFLQ